MGFLDKLRRSITGGKEKVDDAKDKAHRAVDDTAERAQRAGNKAENTVDKVDAASDELEKD